MTLLSLLFKDRWEEVANAATEGHQLGTTYVTTSWDDGHMLDHQMAGLLETYGVPGTFYVSPRCVELKPRERLDARGIAALANAGFEIGGHTLTHIRLTTIPDPQARREIEDGKAALEDITGAPLRSFCYPGGAYEARHIDMVREAGFIGARTVERGVTGASPAFEMGTTMDAYRHLVDANSMLRLSGFNVRRAAQLFLNWDDVAIEIFNRVHVTGGVFHFWGHSWEVNNNGDWDRLERVLAHIGRRSDVQYVDNGELALRVGKE